MAATAPVLAPDIQPIQPRRRGPSRALKLVRQRLNDPSWKPAKSEVRQPTPAELPYEEFCPGALADERCATCRGSGVRISERLVRSAICDCVYKRVARQCTWEYLRIQAIPLPIPRRRRCLYDMPRHEWAADYWQLALRTLNERELAVWHAMRIEGAGLNETMRRARIDRGNLFHALYGAEAKIGKAVLWQRPYALYPVRHYCG